MHLSISNGFWGNLKKPIIGLAPMDGVTDAPFRFIVAKYGKPDLLMTEFTSVEGICAGATKNLLAFEYDESERPVVAQIFGSTPEAFYKSAFVVAELGFDGIDINMGCPAKNISSKGAGASLILTPKLAREIIHETKRATKEWSEGKKVEDVGLPESILDYLEQIHERRKKLESNLTKNTSAQERSPSFQVPEKNKGEESAATEAASGAASRSTTGAETGVATGAASGAASQSRTGSASGATTETASASASASASPSPSPRPLLPVSVKTRIGYNSNIVEEWIKNLLEEEPVNISLHGRTLKQMYTGSADWEAIAKAADIIHQTGTTILGNGDVKDLPDAREKIRHYGVDGVLIGRASFGNPWIFQEHEASIEEKFSVAMEHAKLHEKIFTPKFFFPMRKHLAWYCRGFPGASEVRQQLMQANGSQDVERILKDAL